jgi:RNA polymerase sigma-70 factor (ECF subfamily)
MDLVKQEADRVYKQHFGKLVASLLYTFRTIDPASAEDIVQDAFSSALVNWSQKGIPNNPAGWIYKVCRNKTLNKLKKDKWVTPISDQTDRASVQTPFKDSLLDDYQLKLLFACAHPDLSPKAQVVITLKYVINLKVDAIAQLLGMTIDGVDKLLLRARQKIKDEKIILEEPHPDALKQRLSIVHKIIYLSFNEGYKSSGGKEMIRQELCEEALLLNKSLIDSTLGNKDTLALHALMLFNSARFGSRFTASGELADLENQDRSLWNRDLINLARHFLKLSESEIISTYHLEAAIAHIHCGSDSFATTDWKTIAALYNRLLQSNPNPFVDLNYAIALYYAGNKDMAFGILNELQRHSFLRQYVFLSMALGKFHQLEGNISLARQFLLIAYDQTRFDKERDFIQKMIDKLPHNDECNNQNN